MSLTRHERERLADSRLKLRVVAETLNQVDPENVPGVEEIQECLDGAERTLQGALNSGRPGRGN